MQWTIGTIVEWGFAVDLITLEQSVAVFCERDVFQNYYWTDDHNIQDICGRVGAR